MIGIIYCGDISRAPFLDKYIKILNKYKSDYKVIFWNRSGITKYYGDEYIAYEKTSDVYGNKLKKIFPFIGFSRFVRDVIKKGGFSRLIILTTFSGLIIFPILIGKYNNKFIFDFRDLTYERIFFFRIMVRKISEAAFFTCVSSPEFRDFVEPKIVLSHNFRYDDINDTISLGEDRTEKKQRLLHIGISRGIDYNKRLIDLFGGDKRFEVTIAGAGNDSSDVIMAAKKFDNIHIVGEYDYKQKEQYITKCDAMLYYYPCSFNNNRALANKYYDGLIYKKPLVGNRKTYSGQRIENKKVGISVDIDNEDTPDLIYQYLVNMDYDVYMQNAEREMRDILEDDKKYMHMIENFVILDDGKRR